MEPVSAGIMAGASLLSTLGSSLFGSSREKKQREFEAQQTLAQHQLQATRDESAQKQNALANLVAAYRSTLG